MSSDHEHGTREDVPNMNVNSRHVPADRMRQFEGYVAAILTAFGMDPDTPATRDTPRRFSRPCSTAPTGTRGIRN